MITTRHDIAISELRTNDTIVAGNGIVTKYHGTVASIDKKAKWATITYVDGRKARLEMTIGVTVERQEKDENEKAAERRAYLAQGILDEFRRGTKSTPADYVRNCLESNANQPVSYALSYSQLDSLLHAQAKYHVWCIFDGYRESFLDAHVDDDTATIAAFDIATEPRHRGHGGRDPLSRSTSVMSNIDNDLENWAPVELRENSMFGWDRKANATIIAEARELAENTERAYRAATSK